MMSLTMPDKFVKAWIEQSLGVLPSDFALSPWHFLCLVVNADDRATELKTFTAYERTIAKDRISKTFYIDPCTKTKP